MSSRHIAGNDQEAGKQETNSLLLPALPFFTSRAPAGSEEENVSVFSLWVGGKGQLDKPWATEAPNHGGSHKHPSHRAKATSGDALPKSQSKEGETEPQAGPWLEL